MMVNLGSCEELVALDFFDQHTTLDTNDMMAHAMKKITTKQWRTQEKPMEGGPKIFLC